MRVTTMQRNNNKNHRSDVEDVSYTFSDAHLLQPERTTSRHIEGLEVQNEDEIDRLCQ